MNEAEYNSVVTNMSLPNGLVFGLPVVFGSNDDTITVGQRLLLKYGALDVAVLDIQSKYNPNKVKEAFHCYGTTTLEHPAVQVLIML